MNPRRGDEAYNVDDIRADIWKSICECEVVIADVTGFNANVVYELGVAHAAGRETIILHEQRSEEEKFPIVFAAYRRINYTNDAPGGQELRRRLATMLKSIRHAN
jgi:nucleoside 2-deoxyribosyltransferase